MKYISAVSAVLLFLVIGFAGGNFVNNGDGTISDINTRLMWQQATAGPMDWGQAVAYCDTLVLAGFDDWRLPKVDELMSLVDSFQMDPAIDTTFFPDTKRDHYWTSSVVEDDQSAWHVDFARGHQYQGFKLNQYYVRAVRDEEE